ncbi:MAG TPA: T9SS type A sorting domain-containing protein, partial [Terriglobia bacterium]|nr:T9SS type A sorting domain-containing protein [Terriglobia bacterium]
VRFDLKEPSSVRLAIFNILGQKVYAEDWGMTKAGRYNDVLGMNRFASGVYFYRITAVGISGDKFSSFRKMMLVK